MAATAVEYIAPPRERRPYHAHTPSYEKDEGFQEKIEDARLPGQTQDDVEVIHSLLDPFPVDPSAPEETHQITFRALFVGCVLGAIVGGSNMYIGLRTGITFGAQIFGAIFGFAILKPLSRLIPEATGIFGIFLGGPFGPKENCTVQSAANAAGGLGILFVTAIPALYRLGLMSTLAKDDVGMLLSLAAASGFCGIFFAIPLRKYFIIRQRLLFPTPTATAITIRNLHRAGSGAQQAIRKVMTLLITLISAFCFKVMAGYAPGVIYDWHIGWTLSRIGWPGMIAMENFGWFLEFTPAFFGTGMLCGLNASLSIMGGAIVAWGIMAPILVKTGTAVGIDIDPVNLPGFVSYYGMQFTDTEELINNPSPRYWLLWPGVLMMVVHSLVELASNMVPLLIGLLRRDSFLDLDDPTPMKDRVPWYWWAPGLFASVVVSVTLVATQFSGNVGEGILAVVLAFVLSFIGVQTVGATDINPVSIIAKPSQLIFGAISKGTGDSPSNALKLNIIGGAITMGAAAQAGDMTGDLKTGFLLGAKPRAQFVAQFVGAVVAIFLNTGLFVLFTTAAPCIIYPPEDGQCSYFVPEGAAWAAFAAALTSPKLPIPPSAGYTAISLAIMAGFSVVIKKLLIPQKYWVWVPNFTAAGLSFIFPQVCIPFAMSVGAIMNYYWNKRNHAGYEMYMFPIAAGLIAGEGLGGVFNALLAILKVDGGHYGTSIGCPGFMFCG